MIIVYLGLQAINAFANSSDPESANRALEILKRMEFMESSKNSVGVKPDIVSYNSVLNAFAKSKQPIAAQKLLEKMEEIYDARISNIKPDIYSYNIVMGAW